MMHDTTVVNSSGTTAPLRNVTMCATALGRTIERAGHLSGMVVFHGPSGFGKTTAASFVAGQRRAYFVRVGSSWTKRFFVDAILKEMGIRGEKGSVPVLLEKICEQLALSGRPLIIDEMDHAVARGMVPLILDIYEGSFAPIMLIGEERLPVKLAKWEKFHGRIMSWVAALPVGIEDARHLRGLWSRRVKIADDLLEHLVKIAEGSARRIVHNLDVVEKATLAEGLAAMDRATWGDRPLYTGRAPSPRA